MKPNEKVPKIAENFPDATRKLEKKGFGQDTFYDDIQLSAKDIRARTYFQSHFFTCYRAVHFVEVES